MFSWIKSLQGMLLEKYGIQFRKVDVRRSENIVLNINKDYRTEQKKILICYLDYDRTAYFLRHNQVHTNSQEMCQIIKVLIDKNFCIDVCDCANKEVLRELQSDYYDYVLGLGDMFRYALQCNPKAKAILYMTENPYHVSYQKEMERIRYFQERRGKQTALCRTGKFYKEDDENKADAVICVGEKHYFDHIQKPVVRVFPSAFKNPFFENDYTSRDRKHFLVLGVHGFVHKGNDLLLEVFQKHSDWTLHMCGTDIDKECRELGYQRTENVIDCGFMNTESKEFSKLLKKCVFVLLPSCSEGMSTGLMTCMMHGVIPITMRGTGMDELQDFCLFFEDYHINVIEETLQGAVQMELESCKQLSARIYQYANENFTIAKYTEHMEEALTSILRSIEA